MVRQAHHPELIEGSGLLVTMRNKLSNYIHPQLLLQSTSSLCSQLSQIEFF